MQDDATVCQYFDIFPAHPQPESLESFTSYLTRLAEANGMRRLADLLTASSFPQISKQKGRVIETMTDSYTKSISVFAESGLCSNEALQAMTFFHLGRKFGRSPLAQNLKMFLRESVAPYLRYCPRCLVESSSPYYSLIWRFTFITGCTHHGCRLLDHCGYCGRTIPLFPDMPRMVICPGCERNLGTVISLPLSPEEMQTSATNTKELIFLLTAHEGEDTTNIAKLLGAQYAHLRRMKKLLVQEVTDLLQVNERVLFKLEQGDARSGAIFKYYMLYAKLLETSFQDIYIAALSRQDYTHIREEEWVERVKLAVLQLEQRRVPMSYRVVAKAVGVSNVYLTSLPTVRTFLDTYLEKYQDPGVLRFRQRQEEIIRQAHRAVEQLTTLGKSVTLHHIAETINLSRPTLRKYLQGTNLLMQIANAYYKDGTRRMRRREEEILGRVRSAIQELRSLGQPIMLKTLAKMVGMTPEGLYYYPAIVELLRKIIPSPRRDQHWEENLEKQVRSVVEELEASGEPVGYNSVSKLLGVSLQTLRRSLRVQMILEETAQSALQAQQIETKLVERVRDAIELLETRCEPINCRTVGRIVGISFRALQRYPQVRMLVEERALHWQSETELAKRARAAIQTLQAGGDIVEYEALSRFVGVPQRVLQRSSSVRVVLQETTGFLGQEIEAIEQVQVAIEKLISQGERITLKSICKTACISDIKMRMYPRVKALVAPYKKTYNNVRKRRSQLREEELIEQVQAAIQKVEASGEPLTRAVISTMVGVSRSRLSTTVPLVTTRW